MRIQRDLLVHIVNSHQSAKQMSTASKNCVQDQSQHEWMHSVLPTGQDESCIWCTFQRGKCTNSMVNQLTRPEEMPWRKVTGWILLSWTDAWFCWRLQVLILRNSPDCHYGLDHWLYFCVWWSLVWCMNWYSSTWHYHHQHGMQQPSSLYMELCVFSRSSFDANFVLRS